MNFSFATATELLVALQAGEVSSRELLDHQLDRIEARNPELNAVVTLDADRARERAGAADEARVRGESWGPLHGLPMTVKDVYECEGLRTTAGAPELADHVPDQDAVTVARLKDAGAVIVGKTNTPLYAGDLQTFNEVFGRTNNPWDLDRAPGGSSGGSAAAVAAGLTPLELGSDIGGSIRNPSHFCGVYGLKPSWGTVPSRGHIPGPPGSLLEADVNCCGPMARSVADLALARRVLAGPLPEDAVGWSLDLPPADARGPVSLDGLRVAAVVDDPDYPTAGDLRAVLEAYAGRLAAAGVEVETVALPVPLRDLMASWVDLVVSIIGADLPDPVFESFVAGGDSSGADPALRALTARYRDRRRADQRRQEQRVAWARHFETYDLTLAPAFVTAAFPHDERPLPLRDFTYEGRTVPATDLAAWCGGVGASLLPVVALPAGRTDTGLPVGVQVIGPWLEDRRVLALSALLDQAAGGFVAPPAFSS